jgi:hypothetical protein
VGMRASFTCFFSYIISDPNLPGASPLRGTDLEATGLRDGGLSRETRLNFSSFFFFYIRVFSKVYSITFLQDSMPKFSTGPSVLTYLDKSSN